jgi:hypothetical protein
MSEGRAADKFCEFPPRTEQRKEARRAPDFGSPFLCLLSFGEAKESEAAAGPKPGQAKSAKQHPTRAKSVLNKPPSHPLIPL